MNPWYTIFILWRRVRMKPKGAVKVAISIPGELYQKVENARTRLGKSRSAILQEALVEWLRRRQTERLVRQYEGGYREKPESDEEVQAAEAAAVELLAAEEWS
jgi:metal-responsive CopG/Arc/MetJ family transcriptional regulator